MYSLEFSKSQFTFLFSVYAATDYSIFILLPSLRITYYIINREYPFHIKEKRVRNPIYDF